VVNDFPVLSAGPKPTVPLDQWTFTSRRFSASSSATLRARSADRSVTIPGRRVGHPAVSCMPPDATVPTVTLHVEAAHLKVAIDLPVEP